MKRNLSPHIAMKSRLICVAAATFGLMAVSLQLAAQNQEHHHYKLIDLGTFGGPLNYINGDDLLVPYPGPAQNVNTAGTLAGWADTSTLDPYNPFCFNGDCYVSHAFEWHNGFKTDLGVLPGGQNSATSWISANGLIAGASQNGELDPLSPGFPVNHAVLWRDGNIIDLKTLPEGGYESGAEAVNSRGQVVGWAFNTVPDPYSMGDWSPLYNFYEPPPPYSYQNRAFLWENGVMRDLGTLGTGTDAYAMAINELGQVIGISYTSSTPNPVITYCSAGGAAGGAMLPAQDPFLWENGQMIDLGTFGGICGFPSWINNRGQVVGNSDLAGDQVQHPFLWTKFTGMQDLGTLGGSSAAAQMINDFGQIVGGSLVPNGQLDAFLWDGRMHDLGALNGCSYAFAVNAQAQVVGNWGGPQCNQGAFLWENGGPMVDLNKLVSSANGLSVAGAIEISDSGEIVGSATDVNGNFYAMLLIPCDENHGGIEDCDYSLVDATTAAQARAPAGDGLRELKTETAHPSFPHLASPRLAPRRMPRAFAGPTQRIPTATVNDTDHLVAPAASDTDTDVIDKPGVYDLAETIRSVRSGRSESYDAISCPAVRCSGNHTDGRVCGVRLCHIPGVVQPVFEGYDRTYHRACYYGC